MNTRYRLYYGQTFNICHSDFDNLSDAYKFIGSHVFGDTRYIRLEKIEEIDIHGLVKIVPHYEIKDLELSHRMFQKGILRKEELL